MQIVRRLYVYFISAVSLTMLAVGLYNLFELALSIIWETFSDRPVLIDAPDYAREQVSLFTALILVALPIWFFHWTLAQRGVSGATSETEDERQSVVRAIFLAAAMLISFIFWLRALSTLLDRLFVYLFGASAFEFGSDNDVTAALAALLVSGGVAIYHGWVRSSDERRGPLEGEALWPARFYLYLAAFVGSIVFLIGVKDLIEILTDLLFDDGDFVFGSDGWRREVAAQVAQIVTGFTVWALHWGYGLRLFNEPGWRGAWEQRSVLRRFYLYLVVLVGVFITLRAVSESLEALLRWVLDATEPFDARPLLQQVIEPPLLATPFTLFWLYHRVQIIAEARRQGEAPLQLSVRRLYTYLIAFVGLAFAGVGIAYILSIVIELLFQGAGIVSVSGDYWGRQVAGFAGPSLVGAGAWLWHWNAAQRRLLDDEQGERGATTRRVYLYLVLAATLLAILASLAVVIYRFLSTLLNTASSTGLADDLGTALGIVLVAGALLVYHGMILRHDLAARPGPEAGPRVLPISLTGPPDADLDAVLDELRTRLPEGYALDVRRGRS